MARDGRPLKYAEFIRILDLNKLYAPFTVVMNGEANRLFTGEVDLDKAKKRTRISMNQFARNHGFPDSGDGILELKGRPFKAWYGWRWKAALPEIYFNEEERRAIEAAESATQQQDQSEKRVFLQPKFEMANAEAPEEKKPEPVVSVRRGPRVFFRGRRSAGLLLAFGLLCGITLGSMWSFQAEGFRLLTEQGPGAALEWFNSADANANKNDAMDPKVAFGKAWSKFAIGKMGEAEMDCHTLIGQPNLPEGVLANCFFLLANIQNRTGRHQDAMGNYQKAFDIYERLEKYSNLYRTRLGMAEVSLAISDLEGAEGFIQDSLAYQNEHDRHLVQFYYLQTKLSFKKGDYEAALEFSRERLRQSELFNVKNDIADALSDMAFYMILTGDFDGGFETAMASQEIFQQTGDQDKYYFNLINLIMYQKCIGRSYQGLLKQMNNHLDRENVQTLQTYLEFALEFTCPEENAAPQFVGEGTTLPPDSSY